MDNRLYLIVRIVAAGYIFYKLWRLIINDSLGGFWDWCFRNSRQRIRHRIVTMQTIKPRPPVETTASAGADVVGRTNTVYLEDPRIVKPVTEVMSQPLEPSGFIGEEPETKADEVETKLPEPSEQKSENPARYEDTGDDGMPPDKDFNRCLTFEQINEAVAVLANGTADEEKNLHAATVIDGVRNSDLYDFFVAHAGSEQAVESLLSDYLDEGGEPLPVNMRKSSRNRLSEFVIDKYV